MVQFDNLECMTIERHFRVYDNTKFEKHRLVNIGHGRSIDFKPNHRFLTNDPDNKFEKRQLLRGTNDHTRSRPKNSKRFSCNIFRSELTIGYVPNVLG